MSWHAARCGCRTFLRSSHANSRALPIATGRGNIRIMLLTPHEQDRLLLSYAAELARRRQSRGLKLNHPEAIALITEASANASSIVEFRCSPR